MSRDEWLAKGWLRGAFIDLKAHPEILALLPDKLQSEIVTQPKAYLIPLLYDCALVNDNFNQEPWVQVLVCWSCPQAGGDGNFKFGKNPRKNHFPILIDNIETYLSAEALGFAQFDREELLKATPLTNIAWPEKGLFQLLNWVAERYNQSTFPDQWNVRMNSKRKLLDRLWKNDSFTNNCSGVYFEIVPFSEVSEKDIYEVKAFIAIPETITRKEHRTFVKEHEQVLIQSLKDIMGSIPNISVASIDTIKEDQFTKSMERNYHRWQLEHLSYRNIDEAPLPAELDIK